MPRSSKLKMSKKSRSRSRSKNVSLSKNIISSLGHVIEQSKIKENIKYKSDEIEDAKKIIKFLNNKIKQIKNKITDDDLSNENDYKEIIDLENRINEIKNAVNIF